MKKYIKLIVLTISLLIGINSYSQVVIESQCPNTDFSFRDFTNWTGCYCITQSSTCYTDIMNTGTIPNCTPLTTQPIINCGTTGFLTPTSPGVSIARPPLHTILTPSNTSYPNPLSPSLTGLYDSLTNYGLRKIPVGVNQVVRLNSWKNMYETSQLSYSLLVDTNVSGLFVYSYAAVLENPNHGCQDQPYFQIRLTNANGQPIQNTCGNFIFVAGTPGTFVNVCTAGGKTINWFNWQTVGLSLKPYHGQNVKIQVIAAGCGQGGHMGYGYFFGLCVPRNIGIAYCPGSTTAKLTAPSGFRYKWLPSNDTTQSITVGSPVDSSVYQCVISSLFNPACGDTLTTMLLPNILHSNFTYTNACVGTPVNFTRTTTSNTPIYNWFWNFGDPGSAGNQLGLATTPSHTYNAPGTYNVTLIDSLASGCPDTVQKSIIVYPNPTLVAVGDSVCIGDSAKLSISGATTYFWSSNDTTNQIWVHPYSTYPNDTTLTYKVIGVNGDGCMDSTTVDVIVHPNPQISYLRSLATGCEPITVNWTNQTTPASSTYLWDFGDGNTSTVADASHTYHAGLYTVSLTATTPYGCVDKFVDSNSVNVFPQPKADFTWDPPVGTRTYPTLTFTNLTQDNPSFSYLWTFGDGGSDTQKNPIHTFPNIDPIEKTYEVTLNATSSINGYYCLDSIKYTIKIVNDILIFPNIMTPNGDGMNDKFFVAALTDGGAFTEAQLLIYNRWGKKVYENNNYKNDFGGEGLADGVYYFTFKAKGILKDLEYKGSLQILR